MSGVTYWMLLVLFWLDGVNTFNFIELLSVKPYNREITLLLKVSNFTSYTNFNSINYQSLLVGFEASNEENQIFKKYQPNNFGHKLTRILHTHIKN
jgi:hypothetical protein